uniref:Uncharacterized protein n=1 Tax=Setaria italica TaxID=4555 RepID=K3ZKX0_SETIT
MVTTVTGSVLWLSVEVKILHVSPVGSFFQNKWKNMQCNCFHISNCHFPCYLNTCFRPIN